MPNFDLWHFCRKRGNTPLLCMIQMKYTLYIVSKVDIITGRYCCKYRRTDKRDIAVKVFVL